MKFFTEERYDFLEVCLGPKLEVTTRTCEGWFSVTISLDSGGKLPFSILTVFKKQWQLKISST